MLYFLSVNWPWQWSGPCTHLPPFIRKPKPCLPDVLPQAAIASTPPNGLEPRNNARTIGSQTVPMSVKGMYRLCATIGDKSTPKEQIKKSHDRAGLLCNIVKVKTEWILFCDQLITGHSVAPRRDGFFEPLISDHSDYNTKKRLHLISWSVITVSWHGFDWSAGEISGEVYVYCIYCIQLTDNFLYLCSTYINTMCSEVFSYYTESALSL